MKQRRRRRCACGPLDVLQGERGAAAIAVPQRVLEEAMRHAVAAFAARDDVGLAEALRGALATLEGAPGGCR